MNMYIGTIGQLIIVEVFVLFIWLNVLTDAVKNKDGTVAHKRFLLTSIGLVLNAAAIAGIMGIRIYQLIHFQNAFFPGIVALYMLLASGNILFIIAACLGGSPRLIRWFVLVTILWTGFVIYSSIF